MWMWAGIMLFMVVLSLLGFVFVVNRITRFSVIRERFGKKKGFWVSFLILALVMVLAYIWGKMWNAMIIFIHLLVFWLICDGIFGLIQKIRRRKFTVYWAGITAIAVTICYLGAGVFFAHHVFRTDYAVKMEKMAEEDSFRIVGFSDSHVGTTFHADKFPEYVERMNQENPDIVVIAGDFVDDDTTYEDMVGSCEALGKLQAKYGVYYVFGNHDCGYYASRRGYGKAELVENLEKNNVVVLEDEIVPITDKIYLCGRQDAQQRNRKTMEELAKEYSPEKCVIVLDHEPNDYAAESAADVDLVISGHTHGGQFIPITHAGEWIGANDMTYGIDKIQGTNFIVSSGIADWAFKMKTGCISEYFVIDLE